MKSNMMRPSQKGIIIANARFHVTIEKQIIIT
jgi:hypothetical protein